MTNVNSKWDYENVQGTWETVDRPLNGRVTQANVERTLGAGNASAAVLTGRGTTVVYNDIILADCEVKEFNSEVLYDPSKTDQLGRKVKLTVECSYVPDKNSSVGPAYNQQGFGIDERFAGLNLQHNRDNDNRYIDQTKHPYKLESIIKGLLSRRGRPLYMYTAGRLNLCVLGHADAAQYKYQFSNDMNQATPRTSYQNDGAVLPYWERPANENTARAGNNQDVDVVGGWMHLFDTQNGPKPTQVDVTYITGYKHFRVRFTIECYIVDSVYKPYGADDRDFPERSRDYYPKGAANYTTKTNQDEESTEVRVEDLGILSNRWSVSESRDAAFFMQRVTQGKLIVRSADTFATMKRHLCIPPLARGYQRVSMKFIQSPDGLSMDYTIVDQQRYAAPPWPAIDWAGTHKEEVEAFGFTGVATVTVTLRGASGTPKVLLFQAAIKTIEYRLKFKFADNDDDPDNKNNDNADKWIVPKGVVVEDKLHEPVITVSATVLRTPDINRDKRKEGDPQTMITQQYGAFIIGMLGKLPAQNANARSSDGGDEDQDRQDQEQNPNPQSGEQENGGSPNPDYASNYNWDRWPTPLAYDSNTPAAHMAAYLQEPNLPYHAIPVTDWNNTDDFTFTERDYSAPTGEEPKNPTSNDRGVSVLSPDYGKGIISVFRGQTNAKYPTRDTTYSTSSPNSSSEISNEHQQFQYNHYEVESKYCTHEGIQGVPVSGFPQSSVSTVGNGESSSEQGNGENICFVKMHQPITYRTVYVKAFRNGAMPAIPELPQERFDPNGIREILVEKQIIPASPQLSTNQKSYENSLELYAKYALARTPTAQEKLIAGSRPYDMTTPAANEVVVAEVSTPTILG